MMGQHNKQEPESKQSCYGAVDQPVEHPSKGPKLVQLYWPGFDSRARKKVVGKKTPCRAIRQPIHKISCVDWEYSNKNIYQSSSVPSKVESLKM